MKQNDDELEDVGLPPSETQGKILQAIIRGAVSAVPVVGAPAVEALGLILEPAVERRREAWLRQLAIAFDRLEERVDAFPQDLVENEEFVTTLMRASTAAMRTHEIEKLEALRNAVVASATADLDDFEQSAFIRYVDELTAFHLRLLLYLRNPARWFEEHGIEKPSFLAGSGTGVLELGMPELAGERDRYSLALSDLGSRGLADVAALSGMMSNDGLWAPRTTAFGDRFFEYIAEPDESPTE